MKISPSRLQKFRACQRRYAYTYLHGNWEATAASAQAGTEVHALLEKGEFTGEETWQAPPAMGKPGKLYQTGRMATALRDAAPAGIVAREQDLDVELEGVTFTMRIDAQTDSAVVDYKTTSKSKYVKNVDVLETDEQRLVYTQATQRRDAMFIYGAWENFSVTPVVVPGDEQRDRELFRLHVIQPAEELMSIASDVDPLTLTGNTDSCGLYPPHGCPFQNRCYDNRGRLINKSVSQPLESNTMIYVPGYAAPAAEDKPALTVVAPATESEDSVVVPLPTGEKLIGTLYVDAYPVSGVSAVQHAGEIIARAAAEVCSDAHVLHSQLVEFGRGQHMLAAQLKHDIVSAGARYEHMYLETRSAEGKAVMFELTQLAERVVRGMI